MVFWAENSFFMSSFGLPLVIAETITAVPYRFSASLLRIEARGFLVNGPFVRERLASPGFYHAGFPIAQRAADLDSFYLSSSPGGVISGIGFVSFRQMVVVI